MRSFTAHDRCDRCNAQAYHSASKPGFTELLFCNHHYREHKDSLFENYWLIVSDVTSEAAAVAAQPDRIT